MHKTQTPLGSHSKRVHLTLPTDLLDQVDAMARSRHTDRSELIRFALVRMTESVSGRLNRQEAARQ